MWTTECQSAFLAAKSALLSATLGHHPHKNAKTSITVETSDREFGGKQEQFLDSLWCPVAFFSRKLTKADRIQSAFNCELFPIFFTIKHFTTTSNSASSPSLLTINHSPFLSTVLLSDHPVTLDTCPLSVSFPPKRAMSVEKITLSLTHFKDRNSSVFLMIIDYRPITTDQATLDKIAVCKTSITRNQFDNIQFNDCTIFVMPP